MPGASLTPLDLSLIIPAYNEARRLRSPLEAAHRYLASTRRSFEIIVVDDGSEDGTSGVVRHLSGRMAGIRLIRLPGNRGKGYAVRTGVLNALGELVLFADADGSTPIREIERLLEAIHSGADVAIGSRAVAGEDVRVTARLHRRMLGRVFHSLVRLLAVRGLADTQCGFKILRAQAAQDVFSRMRMDGFSFDVELLLITKTLGYRVAEVPVNWAHQPGSQVHLLRDSWRMARDLFRIRGHHLRGDYRRPLVSPQVLCASQGLTERPERDVQQETGR